jgi:hypothetical protein
MSAPYHTGTGGDVCPTPAVVGGPIKWGVSQDKGRGREYHVTFRVQVAPLGMGPLAALFAEGLPAIGTVYQEPDPEGGFLSDNWAYWTAERTVEQEAQEKPGGNQFFLVTCNASTRPGQECTSWEIDNPLAVPDRIRAESVNYQKEAFQDYLGNGLLNSAFEQFRGKEVEYDAHRVRIVIEGNRSTSGLADIESYMNYVNDMTMWGYPPRTVKLSHFESEPRYYVNCFKYWVNKWTFDVADDFDRCILDEGTKCLRGDWDKVLGSLTYGQYILGVKPVPTALPTYVNPEVPTDFIRFKDWHGQNTRVLLNGNGRPYNGGNTVFIPNGTITGATNASPIVVTSAFHNLVTNDLINISGVTGNLAANGLNWTVTVIDVNTFELNGSTGSGAYTGRGTWTSPQTIGQHCFQYYPQTNLLALGVPSIIDPSP